MISNVSGMIPANFVRLAQLDRAFGYGPKGRGFESSNARFYVRLRTLKRVCCRLFFCAFL